MATGSRQLAMLSGRLLTIPNSFKPYRYCHLILKKHNVIIPRNLHHSAFRRQGLNLLNEIVSKSRWTCLKFSFGVTCVVCCSSVAFCLAGNNNRTYLKYKLPLD